MALDLGGKFPILTLKKFSLDAMVLERVPRTAVSPKETQSLYFCSAFYLSSI
jgi:hypothetical protein